MAATKAVTAIGRRKTSNARVQMFVAKDVPETIEDPIEQCAILVNSRKITDYFPRKSLQLIVVKPLEVVERTGRYEFKINVKGGGTAGQAGAVLHGISRALQKAEPELHAILKKHGLLTRDPRAVERKKPGRHKARKRPQFSKR